MAMTFSYSGDTKGREMGTDLPFQTGAKAVEKPRRVLLYGKSVILGTLAASLKRYPQMEICVLSAPFPTVEELKAMAPDVILFGKQSIDFDDAQVGTAVAEMLGLPSVGVVVKIDIQDGNVVCQREIEGGHETVETRLPAVFLAQKGLNDPRYPSLKGIMAAKSKPIEEKPAAAAEPRVLTVAMRKPPAKSSGKILGTDKTAVPELVRLLHDEAKVI